MSTFLTADSRPATERRVEMDVGILRALKTLKNHPYVQYVGLGFAGLVKAGAEKTQVLVPCTFLI